MNGYVGPRQVLFPLVLGIMVALLSCYAYGPWKEFPEGDPLWCGPGERAVREARSVEFITAGGEVRWGTSKGEYLIPKDVARDGIRYLEETGVINKVRGYGSSYSYDYGSYSGSDVILVSVKPSVFILADAPLNEQRRWYRNRRILLIGTDQERGVEYGTQVPYSDHLFWFSPDLKTGVRPVLPAAGGGLRINFGEEGLSFSKKADVWTVSRP